MKHRNDSFPLASVDPAPVMPGRFRGFSSLHLKCLQVLSCAGLSVCISLPALADQVNPVNPPSASTHIELSTRGDETDKQDEARDRWQQMSPGERTERRKAMYDHWKKMSPGERDALRKKMKEHWDKLTPEERTARRKEIRERWKNMSPDERDQLKRDMGTQDQK